MDDQNFTTSFTVEQTPEEAFAAINNVRGWWSEDIVGRTEKLGDDFSFHYEDIHRSEQKITEFDPGKQVVWHVVDAFLSFTQDPSEWKGTDIIFNITINGDKTDVRFSHAGLVPDAERFEKCSTAWRFYINGSLRSLITTGKGEPNPKERVA